MGILRALREKFVYLRSRLNRSKNLGNNLIQTASMSSVTLIDAASSLPGRTVSAEKRQAVSVGDQ
jgi:hypothetical protein